MTQFEHISLYYSFFFFSFFFHIATTTPPDEDFQQNKNSIIISHTKINLIKYFCIQKKTFETRCQMNKSLNVYLPSVKPFSTYFLSDSMHFFSNISICKSCDGKIIKIPRWDFIFRMCEDGAVWHLIPRRISPCSESFLGHIGTGILCGID